MQAHHHHDHHHPQGPAVHHHGHVHGDAHPPAPVTAPVAVQAEAMPGLIMFSGIRRLLGALLLIALLWGAVAWAVLSGS